MKHGGGKHHAAGMLLSQEAAEKLVAKMNAAKYSEILQPRPTSSARGLPLGRRFLFFFSKTVNHTGTALKDQGVL